MSHHEGARKQSRAADARQFANLLFCRRPPLSSSAVALSEFGNSNLEPLFTSEQIQARVAEMGAEVARDYAGQTPLLVGVLKGAYIFLSDLVRATDLRLPNPGRLRRRLRPGLRRALPQPALHRRAQRPLPRLRTPTNTKPQGPHVRIHNGARLNSRTPDFSQTEHR